MRSLIAALKQPDSYDWRHLRPWQRHSLVLAVAGVVYVSLGCVYLTIPLTPDRAESLKLALAIMPMKAWACAWIVVGLLALTSTRWPPASKTWGYSALTGLAAAWGSAYLLGVLLLGVPAAMGAAGALVWFLVAFLWWAISGLMNPDDVPKAG